jgi:hypothetical protein
MRRRYAVELLATDSALTDVANAECRSTELLLTVMMAAREYHDADPGCPCLSMDEACPLGEALNDWEGR